MLAKQKKKQKFNYNYISIIFDSAKQVTRMASQE